jgi:hypothetical protein
LLCAHPDHLPPLLPDTIFTTAALPPYTNTAVKSHHPLPLPITHIILCIVVFIIDQQSQIVNIVSAPPFSLAEDLREDMLNQCNGASDSKMKEPCYLVQDVKIGTHHYGLYCTIFAQTSIRVLRMRFPRLRSMDQILK